MAYVPIPPAAVLPADGKSKKLRLHNNVYLATNVNSPLFVDMYWAETRFSIGTSNAKGELFLANRVIFPDLNGVSGEAAHTQKSFFEWLTLYQGKAVSDAQVFIDEEKTRAEGVEAGLQSQISNLLSNTDPVALNSLAELVADYTANGSTITTALQAEAAYARAEALDLRNRVAALETLVANLVNAA